MWIHFGALVDDSTCFSSNHPSVLSTLISPDISRKIPTLSEVFTENWEVYKVPAQKRTEIIGNAWMGLSVLKKNWAPFVLLFLFSRSCSSDVPNFVQFVLMRMQCSMVDNFLNSVLCWRATWGRKLKNKMSTFYFITIVRDSPEYKSISRQFKLSFRLDKLKQSTKLIWNV